MYLNRCVFVMEANDVESDLFAQICLSEYLPLVNTVYMQESLKLMGTDALHFKGRQFCE